jgi:hypothetical protein
MTVRFGGQEVEASWIHGRTIVLARASIITLGPTVSSSGKSSFAATTSRPWTSTQGAMSGDDALRIDASGGAKQRCKGRSSGRHRLIMHSHHE